MAKFQVATRNNSYQLPTKRLVVGLGNVGDEYEHTRHNSGFLSLDYFQDAHELNKFSAKSDLYCDISEGQFEGTKLILAKPTTLMNNSSQAVFALMNYFELTMEDILVVHDDLDIEFGTIKTKIGGGSGGHNGIKSIDNTIGEDYARIRIGIANEIRQKAEASDFVLAKFSRTELKELPQIWQSSADKIEQFINREFNVETTNIEQ